MERKVKFRGKRVDNGEWVYGQIVVEKEGKHTYTYVLVKLFLSGYEYEVAGCSYYESCVEAEKIYEVISETVGQFTGLCDKNGKEIYEGDIVKYFVYPWKNYFKIGAVKFGYGSFYLDGVQEWISDEVWVNDLSFFNSNSLELIGNIYDNPELLRED